MVDYVVKLTKDATKVSPLDHERLRGAGFDDRAILQITLIASWFNYINRVADALGVGRDERACRDRINRPAWARRGFPRRPRRHSRWGRERRTAQTAFPVSARSASPREPAIALSTAETRRAGR